MLPCRGRRDGIGGASERIEERIALRIDLDAPVTVKRVTQDAPMLEEHFCVRVAELVQQPRRSLDVRE
jgi:spore coat polysaccharide biosynthesis protein SpsF (cytidylyltransferase family)